VTMRDLFRTTRFEKDLERAYKTFSSISQNQRLRTELGLVIGRLLFDVALEVRHRDHQMTGNWAGYRDCHVFNDLVLIYRKYDKGHGNQDYGDHALVLTRVGSHSELGI